MENQKQPKSNNDKLILGIILGAILGFVLYWSINMVAGFSENIFLILITIFITVIMLFLVSIWGRKYVIRKLFGKNVDFDNVIEESQETIISITNNVSDTLPLKDDTKEEIKKYAPKLINFLIWSRYRNWSLRVMISFLVALGSLVVTILTLNQNKLIEDQNKRIDQQTKLINQQNILSESSRRSSQMFIMGEVFSDINDELREIKKEKGNKKRILSKTLVGRIISLSRSMRPYRYLENNPTEKFLYKLDARTIPFKITRGDNIYKDSIKLSDKISPERGQLLLTLLNSDLDTLFFKNEFLSKNKCNFKYSDLNETDLSGRRLPNIDLSYSKLLYTILDGTYLKNANMSLCDLSHSKMVGVNLSNSKFRGSNLSYINAIRNSNFQKTSIDGSNINYTFIIKSNFSDSRITGSDLSNSAILDCTFKNVTFEACNFTNSLFDGSNLEGANFERATLKKTDLRNTTLRNANFTDVITLDSVIVDRSDWIIYIKDSLKLKGANEIYKNYKIKKEYILMNYYDNKGKVMSKQGREVIFRLIKKGNNE